MFFKELLGHSFSEDEFVESLKKGQSLPSLLNHDEMLLGILLGYGKESASSFKERKKQCTETYAPSPTDIYCRIDLNCPQKCNVSPVVFMGNPKSNEVKKICATYESELKEFWTIYKNSNDHLKMVLHQLCCEN